MSAKDVVAFGLARAQRMQEEDENAARMYGVPRPLCVPRVLPPAPPRPRRSWEKLVAINARIRQDYLEMKHGLDIKRVQGVLAFKPKIPL